ncbi:adenylate/guanylate cyclase domain-containing protein [Thermodesulfobacteriota bacterium]
MFRAYHALEIANQELEEAKERMEDYNRTLEQKVDERTAELKEAQEELMVLNRGLEERVNKQVEELKRYNDLRRYLSPNLADKILTSGDILGAEPRRKMMTVMFSDIRGFSTLTDNLEPEELFHLLDNYLSEMTKLIHQYEGTLNKIIGDGMLIFFGDPVTMEDHAQRSILMAIEMQKKAVELKKEWHRYGHEFGMGIGINTGYMTVGSIGSNMHMDYIVIV